MTVPAVRCRHRSPNATAARSRSRFSPREVAEVADPGFAEFAPRDLRGNGLRQTGSSPAGPPRRTGGRLAEAPGPPSRLAAAPAPGPVRRPALRAASESSEGRGGAR